jgi:hypothetical protein
MHPQLTIQLFRGAPRESIRAPSNSTRRVTPRMVSSSQRAHTSKKLSVVPQATIVGTRSSFNFDSTRTVCL